MKLRLFLAVVLLTLTLAVSSCTLPGTITSSTPANAPSPTPQTQPASTAIQPGSVSAIESTVEAIYAQVNPSVVNISVLLSSLGSSALPPNHPSVTPTPTPGSPPLGSAQASGFVWDTNGDIITNNHVVDGASRITVTFYDGTTVDATLVGTDPDSDLAVIKVNVPASQLHPVKVADSNQLKVGQLAIAIGNPFGLQGTMTVGFISGLGRVLPANSSALAPSYSIPDIIQTDASINPGNSGGVLLDASGLVMGITFAIDTNSGSSAGVGFAIPSAIIQQVAPSLINTGHYDHPWLGLSITSLDPDLAAAMNLPAGQRGALVMTVTAGGPADKAGLQASNNQVTINGLPATVGGDVITAFNGQEVKTSDDLISVLAREGVVGQKATLTILRGGKEMQVTVTLGARPAS
jgi:S1-C subfamily serine protease